jgi:hypothetical protein
VQPQAIKARNRSQDEPMTEIESGETYSGIKFKGLIVGLLKFYNLFLTAKRVLQNKKPANTAPGRSPG